MHLFQEMVQNFINMCVYTELHIPQLRNNATKKKLVPKRMSRFIHLSCISRVCSVKEPGCLPSARHRVSLHPFVEQRHNVQHLCAPLA